MEHQSIRLGHPRQSIGVRPHALGNGLTRFVLAVSVFFVLGITGCRGGNLYSPGRTVATPPLSWNTVGGAVEVTMQAPNPGWLIEFDTKQATRDGPRLLFTIRRPDPGMIYASRIVEKTVRTDQPMTDRTRVWVRVTDHDSPGGRYSLTELASDSES